MIKEPFTNETIAQALGWRVTVSRYRHQHYPNCKCAPIFNTYWADKKDNVKAGFGKLPNWIGNLDAVLATAISRTYDFSVSHKYLGRGKGRETYSFSVNIGGHEVKGFIGADQIEEMAEIGARALLEKLRIDAAK